MELICGELAPRLKVLASVLPEPLRTDMVSFTAKGQPWRCWPANAGQLSALLVPALQELAPPPAG
jgi:hypothetical protein